MRILIAILFALASPAASEPLFSVTGDLNGDGLSERAELVETEAGGMADLLIFTGQSDGRQVLSLTADELVWVGGIGQQPDMEITEQGSLLVGSMNEAVGRNRWYQTLTVAWRGGAFLLAGFTYNWYDTLDLAARGSCDVNLITGYGKLEVGPRDASTVTEFRTDMRAVPVAGWAGNIPPECGLW